MKFTDFILDVDGVLTTGHFIYTLTGKSMKIFGPDDNDALNILKQFINISFITGDKKGYPISEKRIVDDMNFKLTYVDTIQRIAWIKSKFNLNNVIYMGDGIFDHLVMREVGYSICPANADLNAKKFANFVTNRKGGDRAVAEACIHIMDNFFVPFDKLKI